MEMSEKLVGVKKIIAMDIRPSAGATPVRVNVEYDFSNASVQDVVDWAVHASGLRVAFQNRVRPKGEAYLKSISGTTQVVKVERPGTRESGMPSHETMLRQILGEKFETMLGAFGDIEKLWNALMSQAREMHSA